MDAYPKWKYSTKGHLIVQNEAEEKALGEGWVDNPAHVKPVAAPKPTPAPAVELPEEKPAKAATASQVEMAATDPQQKANLGSQAFTSKKAK